MNYLVRLTTDEDGYAVENPVWCLIDPACADADRTLCGGEVFGAAEGCASGEERTTQRGGITCPQCIEMIKTYKAVKL